MVILSAADILAPSVICISALAVLSGESYTEMVEWLDAASSVILAPLTVALSIIIWASWVESASKVTSPAAKPAVPSAVMVAPPFTIIFCDCRVISPESAIDASLICAEASDAFVTRRLDTTMPEATVILSSACKVRLPAFQLSEAVSVPPEDVLFLRIWLFTSIDAGSISTAP